LEQGAGEFIQNEWVVRFFPKRWPERVGSGLEATPIVQSAGGVEQLLMFDRLDGRDLLDGPDRRVDVHRVTWFNRRIQVGVHDLSPGEQRSDWVILGV
jgi:hypothetical protein